MKEKRGRNEEGGNQIDVKNKIFQMTDHDAGLVTQRGLR